MKKCKQCKKREEIFYNKLCYKCVLKKAKRGLPLLGFIFAISLVLSLYSGESQVLDLSGDFYNITSYEVNNNLSAIGITINETNVTIKIPEDYEPSTFSITFSGYNERNEEISYIYSGGSSGGSCLTDYDCSAWSSCINGKQTRTCTKKISYCYAKPMNLTQTCIIQKPVETKNNTIVIPENDIDPPNNNFIWVILAVILLIIAIIFVIWYILNDKEDPLQ